MPACVSCGREGATAEFRHRRNHPGEYVCWDSGGCRYRVRQAKLAERARNLSQLNQRRIEIAEEQLTAVRDALGPAFDAPPLAGVRDALTQLQEHRHGKAEEAA